MPLHLLINASNIASAGSVTLGTNLLGALGRLRADIRFTIAAPEGAGLLNELDWKDASIVHVPRARWLNSLSRLKFEMRTLPAMVRAAQPDAVLALGNIAPSNTGVPTVVLLQQLLIADTSMKFPVASARRWNVAVNRRLFARTARHAAAIVVQTPHMKDLVIQNYRAPAGRVKVISNTVSEKLKRHIEAGPGSDMTRSETADPRFTLFYPATVYPYKNHSLILDIAERLRSEPDTPVRFVVTADESNGPGRALIAEIKRRDLGGIIENAGFLDTDALAHRYRSSSALFFPSLAESFGNPLIEAAAFGLPVIAADLPYARDVLGDAAIYFDPLRPESALDAIRRMADLQVRREYSERSRACFRAAPTWDEIGAQFLQVIKDAASR